MFSLLEKDVAVCWIILHVMSFLSHQHQVAGSETPYDVIVVGAGPSGVAALSRLHQAGLRVLGLEAESRIGGRILSRKYGTGIVEFGAEWVHGRNVVYELAKKAHVKLLNSDIYNFLYLMADGRELTHDKEDEEIVTYMLTAMESMKSEPAVSMEDFYNKTYEAEMSSSPDLKSHNATLDALMQFYERLGYTDDGSGDWHRISTKGWTDLHKVDGPQNMCWVRKKGYVELFDVLMDHNGTSDHQRDQPIDIKLNKEVVHVNWVPESKTGPVSLVCADGSKYHASLVIVTVSLGVLKASHQTMFTPPLPAPKVDSINKLEMGAVIKMCLRYENVWWNDGINLGFVWAVGERNTLSEEDKWLGEVFGATKPAGSDNVLTLWVMGQSHRFVEDLPLETLKRKLDWLVRKFCEPHYFHFEDSVELRRSGWITNPHFLGTYTYHGLPCDNAEEVCEELHEPITHSGSARVLFAGEATSLNHFSTVHGAVESGWREADRVLAGRF